MNVVTVLHNKAMEFADEALLAKMEGNEEAAIKFFEKAFLLEKEAFNSIKEDEKDTLSKHILIRSAASLALNTGNVTETEKLIQLGLSNDDSPELIKQELRDLNEKLIAVREKRESQVEKDVVRVIGIIIDANADESRITVKDLENNQFYTIWVPQELLNQIIRSYWSDTVQIKVMKSAHGMVLEQIDKAA